MAFSGGVKLGDLDDFISPSQECVKPLIQAAEGGSAKLDKNDSQALAKVPEVAPLVQKPNLIKSKKSAKDPKAEIGQVSLSDCLACSGCVTSAETVLLQEQSGSEFLKRVASSRLTVVSIFGEARTSLAQHCGVSPLLTMQRVASVLHRLGANYVLEGSAAEAIALLEGKAEFVRRFREANGSRGASGAAPLPLLTSHCPGWTCYAEKVVDPAVMPHLSPLRPPQQVQGRLVKSCLLEAHNRRLLHGWWRAQSPLFAAELWWRRSAWTAQADMPEPLGPGDVYHVSVQPCFDRKIEASRPHFQVTDGSGIREVDTVLTTTEILELAQGAAGDAVPEVPPGASAAEVLAAAGPCLLDGQVLTDLLLGDLRDRQPQPLLCAVRANAGSGGFIEHVFREAASELFRISLDRPLEFQTRQNEDMREVSLREPGTDRLLLRFVAAHGFRNIQNVIRRITKMGVDPSKECGHFVEIMACPGGCLNGGGQIPAPKKEGTGTAQLERRQRLEELEAILHSGDGVAVLPPAEHPLVLPLYRYIVARAGGGLDTEERCIAAACAPQGRQELLGQLVGSAGVRSWLSADWRSLKVDSEGKPIVGTSALKW
uniref:Iron hydrogenase large subunit C-terminal domain-containing protein n=1 Tax=Alexandrium monilatum TaxID=311494 RepID=A0A7S4QCL7_9DINO